MLPVAAAADRDGLHWARPWAIAEHVLRAGLDPAHRPAELPGEPRRRATYSGSAPNFAPNPPPTSGVMTRTWRRASRPRHSAIASRAALGALVGHQRVSRPSSPHAAAAAARPPAAPAATRWLTISLGDDDLAAGEEVVAPVAAVGEARRWCPRSGKSSTSSVDGVARVDDGRQRVVVDVDQLGGVLALVAAPR